MKVVQTKTTAECTRDPISHPHLRGVSWRNIGSSDDSLLFILQHLNPGPTSFNPSGEPGPSQWAKMNPRMFPSRTQEGSQGKPTPLGKDERTGQVSSAQRVPSWCTTIQEGCGALMPWACILRGHRQSSSKQPAC